MAIFQVLFEIQKIQTDPSIYGTECKDVNKKLGVKILINEQQYLFKKSKEKTGHDMTHSWDNLAKKKKGLNYTHLTKYHNVQMC